MPRRTAGGLLVGLLVACVASACQGTAHEPKPCCNDLASCTAVLRAVPVHREYPRGSAEGAAVWACELEAGSRVGQLGDACSIVQELLASPSEEAQIIGGRAARGMRPSDRACVVPALVTAYRAHRDFHMLMETLRLIPDERVAALLTEELSDPNVMEMKTLGLMGALASPALPRLASLAASHWDGPTRATAADTYRAISGQTIEPGPYHCPQFVRREAVEGNVEARWAVRLGSSVVELRDVSAAGQWEQQTGACANVDVPGPHLALPVGEECITSRNGFECTGSQLEVWRGGRSKPLGIGGVARLVPRERDILSLDQCCYVLGCGGWQVETLERGPVGDWTRKKLVHGGGQLMAFAVDQDGGVELLVSDRGTSSKPPPCADRTGVEGVKGAISGGFVLLHMDPDGTVTPRE